MNNDSQKNKENNTIYNLLNYMKINPNENSLNRICQEYDECKSLSCFGYFKFFTFSPLNNSNPYEWILYIDGLNYIPCSGGKFYIKILFPTNYPERSPEFCFVTPFYHINVNPFSSRKGYFEHLGHIPLVLLNL